MKSEYRQQSCTASDHANTQLLLHPRLPTRIRRCITRAQVEQESVFFTVVYTRSCSAEGERRPIGGPVSTIAGGSRTLARRTRIIVTRYSHVQVWVQCVARHQIVGICGRIVHQCNDPLRPIALSGTKDGEV